MELSGIVTNRYYQNDFFWQIVYEWEDIFFDYFGKKLYREPSFFRYRILKGIPYVYDFLLLFKGRYFYWEMDAGSVHLSRNSSLLIPCVIDFWKEEADIEQFEKKYNKHKLVLISSREVYEYLIRKQCKIKIEHLPLSISDKYRITSKTHYVKKYDVILMGRQNPVILGWFEKYKLKHPDVVYVYSARKGSESFYHYSSLGEEIGNIDTRDKYIELMRKGRCAFYSTPGTDGQKDAGGFSPVTPRFLELISCGCHVLSRYIENADTKYFNLGAFSPSLNNYEEFESRMDYALNHEVDMSLYASYLEKYYTSTTARKLQKILKEY